MSKSPTPASGLKGVELIKAICTLEELEKLLKEDEAVGEGVEVSQGLAAQVILEKIADLVAILEAKVEGPMVSIIGLILSFNSPDLAL
jgi:hypothetical protein